MKKFRVFMVQKIHGRPYPFNLNVLATDDGNAKKMSETTFAGYKALTVSEIKKED